MRFLLAVLGLCMGTFVGWIPGLWIGLEPSIALGFLLSYALARYAWFGRNDSQGSEADPSDEDRAPTWFVELLIALGAAVLQVALVAALFAAW